MGRLDEIWIFIHSFTNIVKKTARHTDFSDMKKTNVIFLVFLL